MRNESEFFLTGKGNFYEPDVKPTKFRDKLESDEFILKSGMNYTPFFLVRNMDDVEKSLSSISKRNAFPVSIRFKGKGMQPFKPNLDIIYARLFCWNHFKNDATPLGIYEQTEDYDQYRQFNGEIQLKADGTLNAHFHPQSKSMKMRDALRHPDSKHVNGVSWDYKPLRPYVDYICKFGPDVVGPVIELTAFEKPVGVKNERIVIWEIRNY